MTDTENDALCARIDELCAELGKAQLSLDMWHDRAEDMRNRLLAKQAENAKLRELVVRLMGHVRHPPCDGCSFECDGTDLTRCDEWSVMEASARDLGIEVDE